MKTIAPEQLVEQLSWRYATKQFDADRKVPAEQWSALEQALLLSPSSLGMQQWAFVVVENPVVREELKAASWGQSQITDASHLVVFAAKKDVTEKDVGHYMERIAEVRGVSQEDLSGFRGMITGSILQGKSAAERAVWTSRQVYIPIGVLLTSAALMGLDACPMEGIDPSAYDRILGLGEKDLTALAVVAVGYRSNEDGYSKLPKVRFTEEEVILHV
ncbi:NAD(P)H-dependent oxidoreductase [Luteolibacter luteus]|uniref:NAD(P)H-dependent oxidoreductase n=1 Tax=Luteolibacter luteus TaxID=2728835 RepID=A0A858RHA8_9BACT|nr:NAD(P)H-dependent oxidoreductase [Luteolibacter luteus]QJE96556.1 NAD(P)H-dependent oxidoreductase [Luteolibacter luteus]